MELVSEEYAQGPLLNIGELTEMIDNDELGEKIRMELRLKETTGESSQVLIIILGELQAQQARIDQILK
jgi:hypothetical protein